MFFFVLHAGLTFFSRIRDTPSQNKHADGHVKVKMLNAPITLNDIWKIEGKLATGVNASSEPLIPGDEGVGIVEEPGNSNFKRGDWVIPARSGLGSFLLLSCDFYGSFGS